MGSEIHYEGWLIKSPPTKRIWRARWRRRWFALKQGELPGQYLLEYYTDETCKKLKGVIDLDQCEQVDAGLFMERKFQHVFNVKTPHRTYYLAADSDDAMRYWVNCICHVCGLQDLSKVPADTPSVLPPAEQTKEQPCYFNVNPAARSINPITHNNNSTVSPALPSEERTYQNNDFVQKALSAQRAGLPTSSTSSSPSTDSTKFHTMQQVKQSDRLGGSSQFSTLPPASRRTIVDLENNNSSIDEVIAGAGPDHDYYNDVSLSTDGNSNSIGTKAVRPIPEKLKLTDIVANSDAGEPSPALSTASGPYIPISECFSGSPVLNAMMNRPNGVFFGQSYENNVAAPMNSLSRNSKFDIPKSPLHIGHLNLTEENSTQSPKRQNMAQVPTNVGPGGGGGRSSDDSESVFTDDEMASSHSGSHAGSVATSDLQLRRTAGGTLDRRLRPSDSSIENENIGWTAMHRYSKVPFEEKKCLNSSDPPPRPPKPPMEGNTASVVMGPLDSSSCVAEERYEIPRSHRHPYSSSTLDISPTSADLVASSTPYILSNGEETPAPPVEPKLYNRSHFYTNAAPTTLEGHFFRYDFVENNTAEEANSGAAPPPAVNRNLKPKTTALHVPSKSCELIETPPPLTGNSSISYGSFDASTMGRSATRLTKPGSSGGSSLNQSGFGRSMGEQGSHDRSSMISRGNISLQMTPSRSDDKLQYLDLDHTNPSPQRPESIRKLSSVSAHNIHAVAGHIVGLPVSSLATIKHSISEHNAIATGPGGPNSSMNNGISGNVHSSATASHVAGGLTMGAGSSANNTSSASSGRGIVYKTVDFVKTDAFNRTRQDAEMNRASNKDK